MSNYVKLSHETTDQYLAAIASGQEHFLKSIAPFTSWLQASPAVSAAAHSELPTMQEITEANFGFAQKLLKQQQEFTERLIGASELPMAMATSGRSSSGKSAHAQSSKRASAG